MAHLKVLICGGGCAGPFLAYWLARSGHRVTVVERFEALRAAGAQIDIRAQGIEVIKRMGLLDIIRSKVVDEEGLNFVDTEGNIIGTFWANKTGKGAQSFTSEFEIMRGDLVRILYDATKDNVEYVFGKTVDRFEQDKKLVTAHFSDGSSDTFDLLVGADGLGSRTRQAILPPDSPDHLRRLGMHLAYWIVPRIETDTNFGTIYTSPGGRRVMRRSHSPTETQAGFSLNDDSEELRSLSKAPVEQQKKFFARRFQDAGWETQRFIDGMKDTDYFYYSEVAQVQTDTWYKNRVVLLGDAGYCPSPFSGMGITASLVGAYVLAGEINQSVENLPQALANYDTVLRPFADQVQTLNPKLMRLTAPQTWWGVAIFRLIIRVLCLLRIPEFITRFASEERGGWKLPEYPELKEDQQIPREEGFLI